MMVFSDHHGSVASRLHPNANVLSFESATLKLGVGAREAIVHDSLCEIRFDSCTMRVLTGKHAGSRGAAEWCADMAVLKTQAFCSELLDIGEVAVKYLWAE